MMWLGWCGGGVGKQQKFSGGGDGGGVKTVNINGRSGGETTEMYCW